MTDLVPAPAEDDTRPRRFRVGMSERVIVDVVAADYKIADPGVYRFLVGDSWITAEFPLGVVMYVRDLGPADPDPYAAINLRRLHEESRDLCATDAAFGRYVRQALDEVNPQ